MVQLKSFRYLESPSAPPTEATSLSDSHQQQDQHPQESNVMNESTSSGSGSGSSGTNKGTPQPMKGERSSSISSGPSVYSMVGGNLTSSDTLTSSSGSSDTASSTGTQKPRAAQTQVKGSSSSSKAAIISEEMRATTEEALTSDSISSPSSSSASSNEEYQVVEHNLNTEEETDVDNNDVDHTKAAAAAAASVVVVVQSDGGNLVKQSTQMIQAINRAEQQNTNKEQEQEQQTHSSPLVQRYQFVGITNNPPTISRQHKSSPNLINRGQSPSQMRISRGIIGGGGGADGSTFFLPRSPSGGDNLSQLSFGGQRSGSAFEVRWRNVNLMARKSKVPLFIANSQIYKSLFKRKNQDQDGSEKQQAEIYYSPPILNKARHHILSNSVPTISEDSVLGSITTTTTTTTGKQQQGGLVASVSAASVPLAGNATELNQFDLAEYRPILNNISGSVFSGQMTAILGPSGVGKTSLISALTGRNRLEGTGKVSLLGETSKRMKVVTVPQADILPDKLTVEEDLNFTSRLKNPDRKFNHETNINRLVKLLHLESFTKTRIDKLSGGQCRRLSIARELLNSPDIVILDEPTSGLDANTCKKIITALRDLAENGGSVMGRPMSIIITIHQPQIEVYNLFHRIYVMAVGGRAIYEGPPSNLLPTILEFSSLSSVCAINQLNENPAIVAIEVASGEYGLNIIGELALHHEHQAYEEYCDSPFSTPRSPFRSPNQTPLSVSPRFELLHRARMNSAGRTTPRLGRFGSGNASSDSIADDKASAVTTVSYDSFYDNDLPEPVSKLKVDKRLRRSVVLKSSFLRHTPILMKRCLLLTTRNMTLMAIRLIGYIMVSIGIVQVFEHALNPNEHICPNYETEVYDVFEYMRGTKERLNNLGDTLQQANASHMFFFQVLMSVTMITAAITGLAWPYQIRMFIREYKNGWYSPASFITSQTIAELPVDLIGPTLVIMITYQTCGQPYSEYYWREISYIIISVMNSLTIKSLSEIASSFLMHSVEHAVFISCVLVAPQALLSGITVRIATLPIWLQIMSFGCSLRYAFESLLALRFGYGMCSCNPEAVYGYPIRMSADAVPPQLDNLAHGLLSLNLPAEGNNNTGMATNEIATTNGTTDDEEHSNLFLKFVRLVTDASNQFVPKPEQLGDCDGGYRSLLLIDKGIEDRIVLKWFLVLLFMFVVLRFLTYFAVKTVIKLRPME